MFFSESSYPLGANKPVKSALTQFLTRDNTQGLTTAGQEMLPQAQSLGFIHVYDKVLRRISRTNATLPVQTQISHEKLVENLRANEHSRDCRPPMSLYKAEVFSDQSFYPP